MKGENVLSLQGKTVMITGATDGLGRALASELAGEGATVAIHGRDPGRIADTVREITAETGSDQVRTYRADLADLRQVRELADQVIESEPRLDALVNNAGIGSDVPGGGTRQESADGHELRFAVNYLAGFALTRLLLPLLESTPGPRIVNVSSAGQQAIDFDDVMITRGYSGTRAYCQSKLAQVLFTIDLAAQTDVAVNALHPATYMPTKIVHSPVSSIAQGVEATTHLIRGNVGTGGYYNGLREARADEQAYDPDARRQLRELSERLAGLPGLPGFPG